MEVQARGCVDLISHTALLSCPCWAANKLLMDCLSVTFILGIWHWIKYLMALDAWLFL